MIAEGSPQLQQVTAKISTDPTGNFAYVNGIIGGAVVLLDGTFN